MKLKKKYSLNNTVGVFGDWTEVVTCDGGVAIGFQLKVQARTGGDETAVNDVNMLCSHSIREFTIVNTKKGTPWGKWGDRLICPLMMAVCGIRTQVETENKPGMQNY